MKRSNAMLDAALGYAKRGWALFPLTPGGKTPIHPGGFKIATTDVELIREWWTKRPDANIGISTGGISGLAVIDVDVKKGKDGEASLCSLLNGHNALPLTLEARTPSGGRHLIFAGHDMRCSADKLGAGLDVRADGGYIVAAPSRTAKGEYEWLNDAEVAPMPEWLAAIVAKPKPSAPKPNSERITPAEREALLERLRGALAVLKGEVDEREFWLSVGWAIGRATDQSQEGFDLWLEWAAQSSKHDPARDRKQMRVEYFEKSAEPRDNPVTVATIFQRAYAAGWHPRRPCTDLGNAERVADAGAGGLMFCPQVGKWLWWDGGRWRFDEDGAAQRVAKAVARGIYAEAQAEPDDARRAALARWAVASEGVGKLRAAVELARSDARLLVDVNTLDAEPWLLGVRNGVLDLRTGALRPATPELLITKQAPVTFDTSARAPRWENFIRQVFAGDAALIAYMQRAIGYSLTGDTMAKTLFFMYGPRGDNGKSTLIETLLALLGDYALKTSSETFMRRRDANTNSASPDRVDLRGARLVVAQELSDRQQFDESFLKDVTGGIDRITARKLYEGFITFKPEFKLWLYGNHKPRLRDDDPAAWRRMHLIPFEVQIPIAKQDPDLGKKLVEELPGILNWALEGLRAWTGVKLAPPDKVLAAVATYHREMDTIGRFLAERCVEQSGCEVKSGELYRAYARWSEEENGQRPMGNNVFSMKLSERGFKDRTLQGKRLWLNIAIRQGGDGGHLP